MVVIEKILSNSRGEILKKSWGKNNKKLLLFEIISNYKSLVDKIYLFPSIFSKRKNSQVSFERNSVRYSSKYRSSDYNSMPNLPLENLNKPIDEDDENKNKLQLSLAWLNLSNMAKNKLGIENSRSTVNIMVTYLNKNSNLKWGLIVIAVYVLLFVIISILNYSQG